MALLINAGSTQIPGVHRGPRRGGRRGGFLSCKAVNPALTVAKRYASPDAGESAVPEHRRATVMLWLTLPSFPALRVCWWRWRFNVFNWPIFRAVRRSPFYPRETGSLQLCGGKCCGIFSCSLVAFLTLFVTARERRADLSECLTQVLSGLNLKVQ